MSRSTKDLTRRSFSPESYRFRHSSSEARGRIKAREQARKTVTKEAQNTA